MKKSKLKRKAAQKASSKINYNDVYVYQAFKDVDCEAESASSSVTVDDDRDEKSTVPPGIVEDDRDDQSTSSVKTESDDDSDDEFSLHSLSPLRPDDSDDDSDVTTVVSDSDDSSFSDVSVDSEGVLQKKYKKIKLIPLEPYSSSSSSTASSTCGSSTKVSGPQVQLPNEMVTKILSNLDCQDLLRCRRVNSIWRVIATSISLPRRTYEIRLSNLASFPSTPGHRPVTAISKLIFLIRCLKDGQRLWSTMDQFPCVRFKFQGVSLDTGHMQQFFELYGSLIKEVRFCHCKIFMDPKLKDSQSSISSFARLLFKQAPNIENLSWEYFEVTDGTKASKNQSMMDSVYVSGMPYWVNTQKILQYQPTSGPTQSPTLPNLKTIKLGQNNLDKKIAKEILEVADNLFRCRVKRINDGVPLDKIVETSKVHTIKEVLFHFLSHEVQYHKKLADLGPKLTALGFKTKELYGGGYNRGEILAAAAAIINKVLESSSETLETIQEFQPIGFVNEFLVEAQQIQMPQLTRLVKINITNTGDLSDSRICTSIFPTNWVWYLSTIFPALREITLNLAAKRLKDDEEQEKEEARTESRHGRVMSATDFWSTFFPNFDLLVNSMPTTVDTLKIHYLPRDSHEKFSQLFPNVRHLSIDFAGYNVDEFQTVCLGIWTYMKKLKTLEFTNINLALNSNNEDTICPLDVAFTGFSPSTCEGLEDSEGKLSPKIVEELRKNLSIVELKDLTRLKLHVKVYHVQNPFKWWWSSLRWWKPILSHVSSTYAFQELPGLRVCVTATSPKHGEHMTKSALRNIESLVHSTKYVLDPAVYYTKD